MQGQIMLQTWEKNTSGRKESPKVSHAKERSSKNKMVDMVFYPLQIEIPKNYIIRSRLV